MQLPQDIYQYIKSEEENYKHPIDVMGWNWSMNDHIKTSFYYKHGRLLTGNSDDKPVKNITKPILNLQYRTEDIDVKDLIIYIEDPEMYHLSFLVKKYHDDVFLRENNLDTFFDELNQSRIDYGAGLVMDIQEPKPEIMSLESIVFCDQTDMLSGPIGFKMYYSPSQLKEMEKKGWGNKENGATASIDETIILSQDHKTSNDTQIHSKIPGKYVEVYFVLGDLPNKFIDDKADIDDLSYNYQMHIVCFYKNVNGHREGITLFRKKTKNPFKLIKRDPVYGRALGFGGAEELFEPQVWVNYDIIRMKDMLDAASKIIIQTNDENLRAKHPGGLKNLDNLEIIEVGDGKTVGQLDTFPRNANLFEKNIEEWEAHAQQMGAANDSIMGENPTSGTPFKLQELVTQESHSLHEWRRGQYAKFIEEIYTDWIIPHITREITKGKKFLASLSLEEMQTVVDKVVEYEANNLVKEMTLNGQLVDPQELELYKQTVREDFMKDNNKFIEILKDELKGAEIKIKVNVAGKQKALAAQVDKMVNIFRQIISSVNPQTGQSILDDPRMAKLFNQILENSGLSPIDFGTNPQKQLSNQMAELPQIAQQPVI